MNNNIDHTARVQIERTKTNREALKIEEIYFPKIKKLFRQIVKEYEGRLHFLYEAEKRYGAEVNTIIKSMVTKSYLLGMEYVSRATGNPEYISLSSNDITQIMLQSDEAYRMFWRLVTKYLQVLQNRSITKIGQVISRRKPTTDNNNNKNVTLTDEIFTTSDWEDDRLLDIDTNTELIINGIVATTLAYGTFEKFKEYKQIEQEQILIDEEFTEETYLVEEEGEEEGGEFDFEGDKYVWATEMDDRVCDICSDLEGEEWDIDDPSIVIPRQDTHPHCRCRLLIQIDGDIINK